MKKRILSVSAVVLSVGLLAVCASNNVVEEEVREVQSIETVKTDYKKIEIPTFTDLEPLSAFKMNDKIVLDTLSSNTTLLKNDEVLTVTVVKEEKNENKKVVDSAILDAVKTDKEKPNCAMQFGFRICV